MAKSSFGQPNSFQKSKRQKTKPQYLHYLNRLLCSQNSLLLLFHQGLCIGCKCTPLFFCKPFGTNGVQHRKVYFARVDAQTARLHNMVGTHQAERNDRDLIFLCNFIGACFKFGYFSGFAAGAFGNTTMEYPFATQAAASFKAATEARIFSRSINTQCSCSIQPRIKGSDASCFFAKMGLGFWPR